MIRDLIALPASSRVWVFQADRELTYDEIDEVRPIIYRYADQWVSHGIEVESYGNIFHRRFLVLVADETKLSVSGCSIDSTVHFVQSIGNSLNVDFFDRMNYAIMNADESINTIHHIDFKSEFDKGIINEDTLIFDNLVNTKRTFLEGWIKPIKESWHNKFVI